MKNTSNYKFDGNSYKFMMGRLEPEFNGSPNYRKEDMNMSFDINETISHFHTSDRILERVISNMFCDINDGCILDTSTLEISQEGDIITMKFTLYIMNVCKLTHRYH